jgi:hypothetical protein
MALGAASIMIAGTIAPASAGTTVGQEGIISSDGFATCLIGGSWVYPSNGNGGAESLTENDFGCAGATPTPPGRLWAEVDYYVWYSTPASSGWALCLYSGLWGNTATAYDLYVWWDTFSAPPCGPGYYDNLSYNETWAPGFGWLRGALWSGYEYFPQSAAASIAGAPGRIAPPGRPSWVQADGKVDLAKMPKRIPVLGRNGTIIGYANPAPPAPSSARLAAETKANGHGAIIRQTGHTLSVALTAP